MLWRVSPGSFFPVPKVASAVIELAPSAVPRAREVTEPALGRVVRVLFGARRKTVRNGLLAAYPAAATDRALSSCGIEPGLRAERLSIEQIAALAREIADAGSSAHET
jgi:16S rRNA (adenine1518-N6/adenine1519-N6)-dimethyltransferase